MNRNCRFELRFTKEELSDLTKKARKAKLTNAAFVRRAIRNTEVKEAPSVDVPVFLNEIRRVGYNINQLLKIANAQGLVEVPQLRKMLNDCQGVLKKITEAYAVGSD